MSHSPLKMFRDYQNKHVLVVGQGPVDFIARSLGFSKVNYYCTVRINREFLNIAVKNKGMYLPPPI